MPLLEYALDLLWERREGSRLTHRAYKEFGGVAGALTGTADQLVDGMSSLEQHQARRLLVELVDFREETAPSTRRRAWLTEVRPSEEQARAAFDSALDRLVASRLLVMGSTDTPSGAERGVWIEFAHEALIRRWERLGQWVREDGERIAQLRRLRSDARMAPRRRWVLPQLLLVLSVLGFVGFRLTNHPGNDVIADSGVPSPDAGVALPIKEAGSGRVGCMQGRAEDCEAACSAGDARSCTQLGKLSSEGRGGARRDRERAAEFYKQGCNKGDPEGCTYLGLAYDYGAGVPRNPTRAGELYAQGCKGGDKDGCNALGDFYVSGPGALRSAQKALDAYRRACKLGSRNGCDAESRLAP